MALKIAVAMLKGGAAKTTTSFALAEAAAEAGLAVEVVDTDPMGGLLRWATLAEEEGRPLRANVTGMPTAKLPERIDAITHGADMIIIDGPPPGNLAIASAAVRAADHVLLACPARTSDQDRVPATISEVTKAGKPFSGVLTMTRSTMATEVARLAVQQMGVPLLKTELKLADAVDANYGHRSRGPLRRFGLDLFAEISTQIG
jgi:cellulose biosynthesis protein BcsQ